MGAADQVSEQFNVFGALFDPQNAWDFGHDPQKQIGREVTSWHHIVDQEWHLAGRVDVTEVAKHRVFVGAEQIGRRRHL